MTQEEKQLLFKDLSMRLPYGIICKGICRDLDVIKDKFINREISGPLTIIGYNYGTIGFTKECELSTIKPYLRPMESMTNKESAELSNIYITSKSDSEYIGNCTDYLLRHHLDYHGLIPMGLAIEAPEGMYNIK